MTALEQAANEFLAQKRIAVAGVSRNPGAGEAANVVYRRLRERGYSVFAVNPNADTVEGDRCYHDLKSIDGGVDGVVVATTPAVAEQVVADCAELGSSASGCTDRSAPAAAPNAPPATDANTVFR